MNSSLKFFCDSEDKTKIVSKDENGSEVNQLYCSKVYIQMLLNIAEIKRSFLMRESVVFTSPSNCKMIFVCADYDTVYCIMILGVMATSSGQTRRYTRASQGQLPAVGMAETSRMSRYDDAVCVCRCQRLCWTAMWERRNLQGSGGRL